MVSVPTAEKKLDEVDNTKLPNSFPDQFLSQVDAKPYSDGTTEKPTASAIPDERTEPETKNIDEAMTSTIKPTQSSDLTTSDPNTFRIQSHYSGIAVENTLDSITLVPPLVLDRKICEIELKGNEPPAFRFELNQYENELLIIPLRQLNCEERQTYQFDLTFTDCSEKKRRSNRSTFFVVVYDVNEFVPEFEAQKYEFSVESGERFSHIFEAFDQDCDQTYSSICEYNLRLTSGQERVPFRFSSIVKGKLHSTKSLDFSSQANYSFHIQAKDCGNKISRLIPVTVKVEPPCNLGWKNIKNVTINSHLACLLPEAHFESCRFNCSSFAIESELVPGKSGCLLESEEARLQRCPGIGDNLLETGLGPEARQIYTFHGTLTALEIVPIAEIMPEKFGFATWLQPEKFNEGELDQDDRGKQTIICQTDTEGKNRHHFHFYLHNCNVGLTWHKPTFRRDSLRIETRTQFHWSTRHICEDAKWHYIVLNVDTHNSVNLFVDGKPQNLSNSRFGEPFVNLNQSVSWTIGACWHGKEGVNNGEFVQHYQGKMASLNYIPSEHQNEEPCDRKCLEYLDYLTTHNEEAHVINEERSGGKSRQKLSGLENTTWLQFEQMARNVHYINTASFDSSFSRLVRVESTAVCYKVDTGEVRKFHQAFNITVTPNDDNLIIRTQSNFYSYSNETLNGGVRLFPEVRFDMDFDDKQKRKIESCSMKILPPLEGINRDEGLSIAGEIPDIILLKTPDGAQEIIRGPVAASVEIFERTLSSLIYYTSLANKNTRRKFQLICEDQNRRKSNLLSIDIHTKLPASTDKQQLFLADSGEPKSLKRSGGTFFHSPAPVRFPTGPASESFEHINPHAVLAPQSLHARRTMQFDELASESKPNQSGQIKTFDIVVVAMLTTAGIILIVFMLLYSIYRSRMRNFRLSEDASYDIGECPGCASPGVRTRMFASDSSPDLLTITENPLPNNQRKGNTAAAPQNSADFLINPNFVKSHTLHEFPSSTQIEDIYKGRGRDTFYMSSGRNATSSEFDDYFDEMEIDTSNL